ncbi:hypothetical protein PSEUBRA_006393 [Kalmanozyma brasiliensis GHG001]|uniref:Translation initiation factor 3 N-terminal domain-containing protein n=1 Tax=Kalmanozyma brasiliensis (strain GHG001) TaxID=1365824 RepID=V5ENY3_KALBG|nr:uncharacterized protein PSEUBRA_006393 [Kalmanozyma brasiliensis GHG001]EST04633.1 hypothetical protein PSEUBRA_006393 [Kalmanozyma brasiliensis GHG001]
MRASQQAVSALTGAVREFAARPSLAAASLTRPSSSRLAVAQPSIGRLLSSTSATFAAPPTKTSSSSSSSEPPKPTGPIRDDAILALSQYVRLVDPNTGSLAGPFPTSAILTKLDRSKFFLQQVAPAQPHRSTTPYDPSAPPSAVDVTRLVQFPICRLIDKKEEFDRMRNAKRASSSSTPSYASTSGGGSKEVQLTWSVSPNDLAHKLSKARKEMIRGARINLVVTTESGGRKYVKGLNAKEDERREALLKEIEEFLCKPAEESTGEGEEKAGPIARRLQDVEWQRGGSAAVMSFECFRNK